MRVSRTFPLVSLTLAAALLVGCGKVAPNKPFEGEDIYPLRYPYEPSDLYQSYYPEDPALRTLGRAERAQREAEENAANTKVIVRQRIQTAPGKVLSAPAGGVLTTSPSTGNAPTTTAPAYTAPSTPAYTTPAPAGPGYPDGYKPL